MGKVRHFGSKTASKNKFGATKILYHGIVFDSIYERDRYIYLESLQKEGKISNLRRQVKFVLIPKTTRFVPKQLKTKVKYIERCVELEAAYRNDFCYIENGNYISEEFKSAMTCKLPDYVLRRKLMVRKIEEHNRKEHGQWIFREVVYFNKRKTIITDK